MKVLEQHFSVVLFIMLYKMALTFESVDKSITNQIKVVRSSDDVYYAVQG